MARLTMQSSVKLNSGYDMPRLGFGVYKTPKEEATAACTKALQVGYRHIDSATGYFNEGPSAASIAATSTPRSSVFFTTKIPNFQTPISYEGTHDLIANSLAETKLGYLDLVLIHAPWGSSSGRKDAWKALVECVEQGKVRSIGVSNYGLHHLKELEGHIAELEAERGGKGKGGVVSVGQWESHPWCRRLDIERWCADRNVAFQAFCPIVRNTKSDDAAVKGLADKYGKSGPQILLRWSLQTGRVPLVKSVTPSRIEENADIYDFELSEEDMKTLTTDEYSPCAWDPTQWPLEKE